MHGHVTGTHHFSISIIALGWLGSSLYDFWESRGHAVTGSYHVRPKGRQREVPYDFQQQDIPRELLQSEVILFNLTPKGIARAALFSRFVRQTAHRKIIFISSTSVFGNQGAVTEAAVPYPETPNGRLLLECETLLRQLSPQSVVIRPAGLYGADRHPGRSLSGRHMVVEAAERINLIGLDDLMGICDAALHDDFPPLVHAVNEHHPLKHEYYSDYCSHHGLVPPDFSITPNDTASKIVHTQYDAYRVSSDLP